MSFKTFKKHVQNGEITGSIDVEKFINTHINMKIDLEIINKIKLLLQLNPKDRKIIGINEQNKIEKNILNTNFKYYNVINMFTNFAKQNWASPDSHNLTKFEKLLSIEIGNRYYEKNPEMNENDIILIIYIVKKYTFSRKYINFYEKKLHGFNDKLINNKVYEILDNINFQLYNPEINYINNRNDNNVVYIHKYNINIDTINFLMRVYNISICKCQNIRTVHLALYYYDIVNEYFPNYDEIKIILSCCVYSMLYTEKDIGEMYNLPEWNKECDDVFNKLMKLPKNDIYLPYDYINNNKNIKSKYKIIDIFISCLSNKELINIKFDELIKNIINLVINVDENAQIIKQNKTYELMEHLKYLIINKKDKYFYLNYIKKYLNI